MADNTTKAREFFVDSRFQKKARRPGGLPRMEAIARAKEEIEQIRTTFTDWFDQQVMSLDEALRRQDAERGNPDWVEIAHFHCRQLRDVGTTMGYDLVTFVANNFCNMLDAMRVGAQPNSEVIALHIEALRLARQDQYRTARPEDFPEFSGGLSRLLMVMNDRVDGS